MHRLDQGDELQLDRSQLSYLKHLGLSIAKGSPPQNHKKAHHTRHVLYRALLFTNNFFCLSSACLSNKPKTKAQAWRICKQQT